MINIQSSRDILIESEIKNNLKESFKKCADGRLQLRDCVEEALEAGFTKEEVLRVVYNMSTGSLADEASLCAIVAIGQALRYQENNKKIKLNQIGNKKKKDIEKKIEDSFKKCELARRLLRKCIVELLDRGLTKEEVLAVSDNIVGGLGKNEVSVCAIIALDQVLRYEEDLRAKPIDIVKERRFEREDD